MISFSGITFEEVSAFPQGKLPACEVALPCSYDMTPLVTEFRKAGVSCILFHCGKGSSIAPVRSLFSGFRQAFYLHDIIEADLTGCEAVFAEWTVEHADSFPEYCKKIAEKGIPVTAVFPYQEGELSAVAECVSRLKTYGIPYETGCTKNFVHAFEGPSETWLKLFPPEKDGVPFPGKTCFRNTMSCFITETGEVHLCENLPISAGNLTEKPFSQIVMDSHFLKTFRTFRGEVKEPCASCRKAPECFGCRGRAFAFSGDAAAPDPACGSKEKILKLPCRTPEDFLPHRSPVRMVDTLLKYGDNSCETEAVIRADNPFLTRDGTLDSAAFIELGAQSLAFLDTYLHPGKMWKGMLLEAMKFTCTGRKVRAGDTVTILSGKECEMDPWHIGFFRIYNNEKQLIAEGELKVCQTSGNTDLHFPF